VVSPPRKVGDERDAARVVLVPRVVEAFCSAGILLMVGHS
jgi:hypothetical protein